MVKGVIKIILNEIGSTKLIIAVKYANAEQIKEVIGSCAEVGFNTLQQFEEVSKQMNLSSTKTHFIGQIQSNKIKKILQYNPYLIQSVSSFKIAEKINSVCGDLDIKQKILLQINTDSDKLLGFQFDEIEDEIMKIRNLKNVEILGFMTIPPPIEIIGEKKLREIYSKMKGEYERIQRVFGLHFEFLSMGMSKDYLIAIEEGANMVRIGRKVFEK
jgi:PLP dependent protein